MHSGSLVLDTAPPLEEHMATRLARRLGTVTVAVCTAVAASVGAAQAAPQGRGPAQPSTVGFELTLLHSNDGESQLISAPGQPDFGGIARFATLVDQLRDEAAAVPPGPARGVKRGTVLISSGDNFLAGPRFAASLDKGVPFYDSIGLSAIGYDAVVIGNHEFDFGPDVLADFIEGFDGTTPFLSANLDVSAEPRLAALEAQGEIAASTVVRVQGESIGIVAATTPRLSFISSPRNVVVDEAVAEVVQHEVDSLTARGIDKIVFASHLQSLAEDRLLLAELDDVDVAIAGGGDELLANPGTPLVPGDVVNIPQYPVVVQDVDGTDVPVVTTAGDYKYVGRLVVQFDRRGNVLDVVEAQSGPVRVSGVAPDAVQPNPVIASTVVAPVAQFVAGLASNAIGTSEVALEGRRDPGVRTQETNLGNLLADALLSSARARAASFGVPQPVAAFQNSGGIRNNSLIPAGTLTELTTFDVASFSNFVSVVPDVPRSTIKSLLENAVSRTPLADGRFVQVGGISFEYTTAGTAQVTATDGTVTTPGTRVKRAVLDDGTVLVDDFAVVPGAPVTIVTNDFSARGGDQYPLLGLPFTTVGITYQQALLEHITTELGGLVSAAQYPEVPLGGGTRIVRLP
jgi:5'-nucleotidase